MARNDLPSMINYILKTTGARMKDNSGSLTCTFSRRRARGPAAALPCATIAPAASAGAFLSSLTKTALFTLPPCQSLTG